MQRVTEPELMISPDQVKAYAEADFSSTEENVIASVEKLVKTNSMVLGNETLIIDLGCGPGNISEKLALYWPDVDVIGIDDSSEMLSYAMKRQESTKNRTLKRLSYVKTNMLNIAMKKSPFLNCADVVVSNSLLHHIHDPAVFFKALVNISKSGALHFHRDLRRPRSSEDVLFIQQKHLLNAPPVLISDFKASLHASYTLKEIENEIFKAGIDNLNVIEVEDRYLDIKGFIS